MTTKEENKEGYNNTLFVVKQNKEDTLGERKYSFYNFSGEFLFELPSGVPDKKYAKIDPLYLANWKISFIDDQLGYDCFFRGNKYDQLFFYHFFSIKCQCKNI